LLNLLNQIVDRAISHFTHDIKSKKIFNNPTYDPTKYDNVSRMFDKFVLDVNKKRIIKSVFWIADGIYYLHYIEWLKHFPPEQIFFFNGENFISNPYDEIRKVEKFLNLTSYIKKDHFIYNKYKGFYCLKKHLNNEFCMSSKKGRKHPFISPDTINKIREFYKPYDKKLFSLIGKDPFW
jgi:[heparan sulfate]-glucosamine 3-sulfotransferase 1